MDANERELIFMEALCQYEVEPLMNTNERQPREFISVSSRAFAVDSRRGGRAATYV